jgi:Carboxypeptidase regulatory-like domain
MRTHLGRWIFAAAVILAVTPRGAAAQSAFSGVVRDTSGAVLPGVTIEASSPVLIERTRAVVSDEQGRYTIVDLRPGTYKLTFSLTGFSPLIRDGIELASNVTVPINAELRVGTLEESITVSGATPLVDVQNAQKTQVVARDVLDALPTTRNMQSVGSLVPGIKLSRPDVGGSQGMEQTYMRTHGADDRHTTVQVDGMMVNSSMGDGNIQAYNDDALAQEVSLQTSAVGAEVQAGGVRLNMIPKDGGNSFRGGGFFGGSDGKWQSNNIDDELRARGLSTPNGVAHVQDFNLNYGGPIVRDRLWFFSTARHVSVDEKVADSFYQDGRPAIVDQYVRDALVRLTFQATPKNKISTYFERIWKFKGHELNPGDEIERASGLRDPKHALYYVGQSKWTSTITSRLLFEAGYSTNIERLTNIYQPGVRQDPFTPEWYANAARVDLVTNRVTTAKSSGETGTFPDRKLIASALSYVTGTHSLKGGVQWSFGQEGNSLTRNADLNQNYRSGVPDSVDVYNTPVRNDEYVNADVGVYAQDAWTLKRLTVNGGLRWDYFDAKIRATCRPAGRFVPALCQPERNHEPQFNNLSPRFSAVYDLFGDARTAVKGSVNKYVLPWAGGWGKRYDPMVTASDRRNWSDLNRDDIAQDNEIGASNNRNFGLQTRFPSPDLAREYNVETSVSVQHQITTGLSLTAGYYHRRYYNQEAQDNTLVATADYLPFQVPNPIDNQEMITIFNLNPAKQGLVNLIDRNSDINRTIYDGFELSFNARLPHGAVAFGGWSNDRTMVVSCDQYDPNKLRFCDQTGETFQEYGATSRPPFTNDFKVAGSYPFPFGINASAVFMSFAGKGNSYSANEPFLGVYWVVPASVFPNSQRTQSPLSAPYSLNGGGVQNVTGVSLVAPGTKYQERWNQLDVSVKKVVRIGQRRLEGQVAVFNVTNNNVVLAEVESYGASLGRPLNILQGRMLRLALLVAF